MKIIEDEKEIEQKIKELQIQLKQIREGKKENINQIVHADFSYATYQNEQKEKKGDENEE